MMGQPMKKHTAEMKPSKPVKYTIEVRPSSVAADM